MKVGIVGASAVAHKHVAALQEAGYDVVGCANRNAARGKAFAERYGFEYFDDYRTLCADRRIDIVDICTLPEFRLPPVKAAAANRKHILIEKPLATNCLEARRIVEVAAKSGITLGVVSQHRFDDSSLFLKSALDAGRLGDILQCDAYVKWYRNDEYYRRPEKGTWKAEGGGVLINQAIHQLDLLNWFAGPIESVYGEWRLGATHAIEAEDVVIAVLRYSSGAKGVVQASTSFWPGYSERIEIHGTKGSAVVTGDRLTRWDTQNDIGDAPPLFEVGRSGASDPLALSLESFKRQFIDFGEAIKANRNPLVSGTDGLNVLQVVSAIYDSCRSGARVSIHRNEPG